MLRPARASDADGIRALFFHLPPNDVYTRFFRRVQALSGKDIERLCNYNYENEVGFVAVVGPREQEEIIGQALGGEMVTTTVEGLERFGVTAARGSSRGRKRSPRGRRSSGC